MNTPSPDWLIQDLLLNDTIAVIHGEAKTHKTQLALEMAVSVASGASCLGRFKTPEIGNVIVISPEIDVAARLARLTRDMTVGRNSITALAGPADHDLVRSVLPLLVKQALPRLVIIDDYAISDSRDENIVMFRFLRGLGRYGKVSILLTHPVSKRTGLSPSQRLRGSHVALAAALDSSLCMTADGQSVNVTIDHKAVRPGLSLRVWSESYDPRLRLVRL